MMNDFDEDKLEDFKSLSAANPSDYSEVYLPWGPQ
jgi:hypothetical protein